MDRNNPLMCGRYSLERDYRKLVTRVGAVMARVQMLAARYNIAPTQLAPVIYRESGQTAMKLMR